MAIQQQFFDLVCWRNDYFCIGYCGTIYWKIFDEVKNRQLFIVDETINLEK